MSISLLGASGDEVAAYQLGRQASEVDSTNRQALRTLFGPRTPNVDVNTLVAQHQALATENARLRATLVSTERNLLGLENDYAELRAWADMAFRKLKQNGL